MILLRAEKLVGEPFLSDIVKCEQNQERNETGYA
jgi:hypothetical protein